MAQSTLPYKRSLSGSIGAGVGSLLGGSGKRYYILEHKVGSKYHKMGEAQEIIVDEAELGRDPKCQVRFDESFSTVSRHHAAIVKNGENWKLVQLSQTNPTFLNDRPVQKEWYLQNGDQIQLSTGGPKLGFIVPAGNKSMVGSIGLSRRLSLFRQQALRPYKQAITALCVGLVVAVGGLSAYLVHSSDKWEKALMAEQEKIKSAINANTDLNRKLDSVQRVNAAELRKAHEAARIAATPPPDIADLVAKCKADVYFLNAREVYLTDGSRKLPIPGYSWTGTGFLLNDGRFVTARHCIQGWRFETNPEILKYLAYESTNIRIEAEFHARSSSGKEFTFKSSQFVCNEQYDRKIQMGTDADGKPVSITSAEIGVMIGEAPPQMWSTDWAYVQTSSRGSIEPDAALSSQLRAGTELHVLGFPKGMGVGDTPKAINVLYNTFKVGYDGLDNNGCFLHTRGVDHGNSGGPIFVRKGNKLFVIGIVSRGSPSAEYATSVPISAIYKR
jgi:hypothetical protein